jgi:DnaJ domain
VIETATEKGGTSWGTLCIEDKNNPRVHTMTAVPDPYKALSLPHDATAAQIKRSYRELARKYHPDRCCSLGAGEGKEEYSEEQIARQRDHATARFAAIAAAYALLSDPQRKAQYDHVYKYGGYDDDDNNDVNDTLNGSNRRTNSVGSNGASSSRRDVPPSSASGPGAATRKRKSTGIGYACVDPLAFLWTHGRVQAKMAVAGIQIPSRLHHPSGGSGTAGGSGMAHGDDGGMGNSGFRFAFSSAHLATSPKVWQSKTTTYSRGQKFTRVETTTIHPDGRTETVVDHNPVDSDDHGHCGRDAMRPSFFKNPPFSFGGGAGTCSHKEDDDNDHRSAATTTAPWYAHAWSGIKDKIMMCYSPCTVTAVQ